MLFAFDEKRPKDKRVIRSRVYPEIRDVPAPLLADDADPKARLAFVMGG